MAAQLSRDAQRWLARLPEIANLLLVVLIALSAARLFWLVWPAGEPHLTPDVTGAETSDNGASVDTDKIAGAHMFGEQAVADKKPEKKVIDAPETRLDLELTGIISDSAQTRSRALVKDAHNKQDSYAVGDKISKGVKLHAIYANRVILDRNGRFETLTLESVKQARKLGGVKRTADKTPSSLSDDLAGVRRKILANPATAGQYIRLQPERQNGNLVGYRIYPGADTALFKKAGLKPGELVTAINGKPLNNPAQSLKLLGKLSKAKSASITLEHNGQKRTVTVNFE